MLFGKKRWILYDQSRFAENKTRLKRMTRDINKPIQLTTPEWIRQLYGKDERMEEIRRHGHDCVQGPGEMLYVPRGTEEYRILPLVVSQLTCFLKDGLTWSSTSETRLRWFRRGDLTIP